jgi:[ribosomal protein S5]-alanine N-acetyltransferase
MTRTLSTDMHRWPTTITSDGVTLRPLRHRDASVWREVRARNAAWLRPWEATVPAGGSGDIPLTFGSMVRRQRLEGRAGRGLPWVIEVDGRLVGQLTVGGIALGSLRSAYIGYWIDQAYAGRGIVPTAVAMACDYCFEALDLHRVEINIRPENTASLRVVDKLGFHDEGMRPAYLHIDGQWRDHRSFALFAGELTPSVLGHYRQRSSHRDRSSPFGG